MSALLLPPYLVHSSGRAPTRKQCEIGAVGDTSPTSMSKLSTDAQEKTMPTWSSEGGYIMDV
jgi:hypothetical protein